MTATITRRLAHSPIRPTRPTPKQFTIDTVVTALGVSTEN